MSVETRTAAIRAARERAIIAATAAYAAHITALGALYETIEQDLNAIQPERDPLWEAMLIRSNIIGSPPYGARETAALLRSWIRDLTERAGYESVLIRYLRQIETALAAEEAQP